MLDQYYYYKYQKYRIKYRSLQRAMLQLGGMPPRMREARYIIPVFDYDETLRWHNSVIQLTDKTAEPEMARFITFFKHWRELTGHPIVIFSAGRVVYSQLIAPLIKEGVHVSINAYDRKADLVCFMPSPESLRMIRNPIYPPYIVATYNQVQSSIDRLTKLTQGIISRTQVPVRMDISDYQHYAGADPGTIVVDISPSIYEQVKGGPSRPTNLASILSYKRRFKDLNALRYHIAYRLECDPDEISFVFFDDRINHIGVDLSRDMYVSKKTDEPLELFPKKLASIIDQVVDEIQSLDHPHIGRVENVDDKYIIQEMYTRLNHPRSLLVGKTPGNSPVDPPPIEPLAHADSSMSLVDLSKRPE